MRRALLAIALLPGLLLPGVHQGTALAAKPPPLGADEPYGRPAPLAPASPPSTPSPQGQGRAVASGSGFIVGDGRILTNAHVVQSCGRITARNTGGRVAAARGLAMDGARDLALLGVPAGFGPPLAFRDGPDVRRGDGVVTYGYPLSGLLAAGPTLTTGDISALSGLRDTRLHYQISAPVQPGNSGGPLLDLQGHVVGIVTSKLNAARVAQMTGGDIPQNVNFAVKGTEAMAFLVERGFHPQLASSTGPDRRAAEIGEIADPSTVFLQCYR